MDVFRCGRPRHFLAAAAVAFSIAPQLLEGSPRSSDIAELETAIQQSGEKALGAPRQPLVNVQLGRKSIPKSARRADEHLQLQFSATVAHAKRLDMYGDRFGCVGALNTARSMYVLVAKQ
jgi:hypothetical protein